MLKLKTILFFIFIFNLFCFTGLALAQEATPAGEVDQEKIQEIREAVKEMVKEKIVARQMRGYAGVINKLTETELVLETERNGVKTVSLTSGTQIVNKSNLKEGVYAIAIGIMETEEKLEAKRVVISQKPKTVKRVAAAGKVIDISAEEKLLTVKNEKSGAAVTIEVKDENKFAQVKAGDWVVVVGTPAVDNKQLLTAKIIHIVPDNPSPTPSI
ncbi:MAG: hypothetical protein ABH807_00210 [Candidatus Shapirobacteria bacterium]